jgi:hypothetical protein
MKIVTLIASLLPGIICVVFGLNGFLNFHSIGPMPTRLAIQGIVAKQEKSYAESDKNVRYALWQTKAQRRKAMSYSISTLLTRNLHDVFGENDPSRRRAAIDEIFTEDCVFYEPSGGVYRGRDEIDRVAGSLRTTHADFRYQPIAEPEELGNAGRVKWVEGRIGEAPMVAGTDFIIARDGQIAAVYLFFDKLP